MPETNPKRVIAYIDGFNLYYGLCAAGYRRFLWLDLHKLASKLIREDQILVATKYFTARIGGGRSTDKPDYALQRNDRKKRQSTYLDALGTIDDLKIYYGNFNEKIKSCNKCGAKWYDAEEKMTDVNIATEMIVDAFASRYDVALLISGDSDLVPPIKAIQQCQLGKRINVAFPPNRTSYELKKAADGECVIGRNTLKKSQLPDEVTGYKGFKLIRPATWSDAST